MCSVYCRYDTDCVLRRLLKTDISSLGSHPTDNQLAKLQERMNALKRRIDNWQSIQLLFMPFVARLRDEDVQPGEPAKVEEMKLFLPSEFCDQASCPNKLCEHEWKLREAQAHKALCDLRHFLRLHTHLYKFKDTNVRGQVANTHARTTISQTDRKVSTATEKYCVARAALFSLAPLLGKEGWEDTLRPLKTEDIRAMKDICEKESEGRQTLSWIWKVPGIVIATDASERESLHDGAHSFSFRYHSTYKPQLCASSGAKLGCASFAGKRKKSCCKKSSDVSWHSLTGKPIGGQNKAPAVLPLTMLSRRVSRHTQHGRPFFDSS